MPPVTSMQRLTINQFVGLTGLPEKTAIKLLKASQWRLEHACDSFFGTNGVGPNDPLDKLFESYRDQQTDAADTIGVAGTMKYLEDLGVNLETVEFLIPLEIVQAPTIGEMTKSTFITGWKNIGVESVPHQKEHIQELVKSLKSDMALFKRVYRYTFVCTRESGQKSLPVENALIYWELLFQPPGVPWVTASTNWLELWGEYLRAKWNKTVNRDMWNQTFEFFLKTMEDETLSFWNENSAWPGVIDDFVAYVKEKRGETKETTEDE